MAKQQILLVDADSSSARLLEVSLRSAGFTVATADSAEVALDKLEHGTPDLVLTDTRLPKADGFTLVRNLRARPESAEVPVIFLTEQGALEDKLKGLELGVNDYLAKPIFVREVVTRVQALLTRKRQRVAPEPARTRFLGSLEDVAVVDLLQTVAVSGKSGVASVRRGDREAWLYFDRGQVIDASVGDLRGEEAVYRTITWTTGSFNLEFRASDRQKVIDAPYQALLMEGLRRVDELGRIAEQLPPENSIIELDHATLASRLNEIPDELNAILRLIDGQRTLLDLIDASPFDDLSTLTVLSKFYFEGLISSIDPPESADASDSAAPSDSPGLADALEPAASDAPAGSEPPLELFAPSMPSPAPEHSEPPPDEERFSAPQVAGETDFSDTNTPVPPPRSTPPAALLTEPPPRERTTPPSTVPTDSAPPPEALRQTPAPMTTRVTTPAPALEGKLTPKGIVNVGEQRPAPPKAAAAPSPFRPVNEQPRRSPIPMPDNSLRWNGGARTAAAAPANGVPGDDLRVTRTALGLSATPMHRPPVTAELPPAQLSGEIERSDIPRGAAQPEGVPAAGQPWSSGGYPPRSRTKARGEASPANAVSRARRAAFEAREDDGYEDGYEDGPDSDEPPSEPAFSEPPPQRRARGRAARRARERRVKLLVAAVVVLALTPLAIGVSRRLTWRSDPPAPGLLPDIVLPAPVPAPPASAAPPFATPVVPSAAPLVAPPHATSPAAPPSASRVIPSAPEAPPAPEAAASLVAPAAPAAAPARATEPPSPHSPPVRFPVPEPSPAAAATERRPTPPRATRPPRAPKPVEAPVARPVPAPAQPPAPPAQPSVPPPAASRPAPPPAASRPAPLPVETQPAPPPAKPPTPAKPIEKPPVPARPGEKPPTAAYPLR